MSTFRKKLPIELDHDFMCHILYRFSKEPRLYIVPKKLSGASNIKKGETYWLPEQYALINDEYIAYHSDYGTKKELDWIPANDMTKNMARYGLECHKIDKKKLKTVNKTELVKSGVTSEAFYCKDDEGITSEFETRPKEFWRFRKRWEREFEQQVEWDDTTEVLIFHFEVHRFKPEMTVYDWHIEKRLNHEKREIEYKARLEKQAEEPKAKKKKRKKKKKVNTKKTKKK